MKRHNIRPGQLRRAYGSKAGFYLVLGPKGKSGMWHILRSCGTVEDWWWDVIRDDEVIV